MLSYKLGKNPPPPKSVMKLAMADFFDVKRILPTVPKVFGHGAVFKNWRMLGNDLYGCCVLADAAHQSMLWTAKGRRSAVFPEASVLKAYTDLTGFDPKDPSTDNGTDMLAAARYRQKVGMLDEHGVVHKTDAYVKIRIGNLDELLVAAWLFEAASLGVQLPSNAEEQFDARKQWTVDKLADNEGGHCITFCGRNGTDRFSTVSWGREQEATEEWIERYADEANASLSLEMIEAGKKVSPEGWDEDGLRRILTVLQGRAK